MENPHQKAASFDSGLAPELMYDQATKHGTAAFQSTLPFFKVAANGGVRKLNDALDKFETYVQQGPEGIRFLSFIGGLLVFLYGVACSLNIFGILGNPVYYLICASQVIFGFTAMVLEASPSLTTTYVSIERLQRIFHDYAKFLTLLWGRGCFYIYIGAHIMYLSSLISLGTVLGIYMLIMGAFYLAWNWGYDVSKPTGVIIDKMREGVMKIRACLGRSSSPNSSDVANNYIRVDP